MIYVRLTRSARRSVVCRCSKLEQLHHRFSVYSKWHLGLNPLLGYPLAYWGPPFAMHRRCKSGGVESLCSCQAPQSKIIPWLLRSRNPHPNSVLLGSTLPLPFSQSSGGIVQQYSDCLVACVFDGGGSVPLWCRSEQVLPRGLSL